LSSAGFVSNRRVRLAQEFSEVLDAQPLERFRSLRRDDEYRGDGLGAAARLLQHGDQVSVATQGKMIAMFFHDSFEICQRCRTDGPENIRRWETGTNEGL
jgi:hypothetical protein